MAERGSFPRELEKREKQYYYITVQQTCKDYNQPKLRKMLLFPVLLLLSLALFLQ